MLEEREVTRVGSSTPIPVDVRVIAATHTDLDAMVRESKFRRDLYFRLNVLRLEIPPLRQHAEDIGELAQLFLRRASGDKSAALDADALALLRAYAWPGNVRELRNVIERLPILVKSVRNVDADLLKSSAPELIRPAPAVVTPYVEIPVAPPSRQQLAEAMARAGGHRGRAAALLGVSRTTLWRWLQDNKI